MYLFERYLAGNPEGKMSLGLTRCRWKDNIKINLKSRRVRM
jgi:hypothetical protein